MHAAPEASLDPCGYVALAAFGAGFAGVWHGAHRLQLSWTGRARPVAPCPALHVPGHAWFMGEGSVACPGTGLGCRALPVASAGVRATLPGCRCPDTVPPWTRLAPLPPLSTGLQRPRLPGEHPHPSRLHRGPQSRGVGGLCAIALAGDLGHVIRSPRGGSGAVCASGRGSGGGSTRRRYAPTLIGACQCISARRVPACSRSAGCQSCVTEGGGGLGCNLQLLLEEPGHPHQGWGVTGQLSPHSQVPP